MDHFQVYGISGSISTLPHTQFCVIKAGRLTELVTWRKWWKQSDILGMHQWPVTFYWKFHWCNTYFLATSFSDLAWFNFTCALKSWHCENDAWLGKQVWVRYITSVNVICFLGISFFGLIYPNLEGGGGVPLKSLKNFTDPMLFLRSLEPLGIYSKNMERVDWNLSIENNELVYWVCCEDQFMPWRCQTHPWLSGKIK